MKSDLEDRQMIFIGGPRQVGKTSLARHLIGAQDEDDLRYLNWDQVKVREQLLKGIVPSAPQLIFDEIHKFDRWKTLVKGIYDSRKLSTQIIVTGSARLDVYRKGGDSMQGRYHYFRLHPFTLDELTTIGRPSDINQLLHCGGFPEPYLKGTERFLRRWQLERRDRLIREDIRDLQRVKELSLLEVMAADLPRRVGSPLSVKNIKELLQIAHETAERWISIFEQMYYCFRIPPFGAPRINAVKKEQKLYLWDWSLVEDSGARFENLVASHLLKFCHFMQDVHGYEMELRYLRDVEKREIDFVVLKSSKPIFALECKSGEKNLSSALRYFHSRAKIPKLYQVHLGNADFEDSETGVRVIPFTKWISEVLPTFIPTSR
jgi:predicted AAA+ superfamily ATPase